MNVNLVIIGGNLTKDPELRFTASGTAIAQFAVAVNEKWVKDGEKKEKTTFINCKAWGKTGENIAQYFKKGSRFYGHGKLDVESWDDKETQKKQYKTVVQIESFQFCERGERQEQSEPAPRQRTSAKPSSPMPDDAPTEVDDVPFACAVYRNKLSRFA